MAGSSFAMEQYRVHLVWRLRSSFLNSSVIPANPRVHPRFREEGATRNPASGKGTGNFLEDEKVASPQRDSRWSLS